MKKIVLTIFLSMVFLGVCWGIGTITHPNVNEEETYLENKEQNASKEQEYAVEKILNWEEYNVSFENSKEASDNPWGFTAGLIDTEEDGNCIFMTPNTALTFHGISMENHEKGIPLQFKIHPWVAESSDGVGVEVWYLNEGEEILHKDYFEINSKESWQEKQLSYQNEKIATIKLLCDNGAYDDDGADWLIIKQGVYQNTEEILNWEEYNVSFENSKDTSDNPWGFTAGVIDTENDGKCIFLTPNTALTMNDISQEFYGKGISLCFRIHPWVAESSDGVGVEVWYLDEGEEILHKEYFEINSKESWQEKQLSYQNEKIATIKLLCDNGAYDDDGADWLIIKQGAYQSDFGKNDYVRSATYFGDAWPINFWNSEFENIDDDFLQIKNDGFNSIIIVIPWVEFQTATKPITYSEYAFQKLDYVMQKADEHGLDVYGRVGYTWDFYSEATDTYADRIALLLSDESMKNAWLDYCQTLYKCMSDYKCFKGGFLTWEDFYGLLTVCEEPDKDIRKGYAQKIGYQNWLKEHYSLAEIYERCGEKEDSYEQIATPRRNEDASMELFYEFYDDYLNTILRSTQDVFPNISMEVRLDWDSFKNLKGEMSYYSHEATFSCANSDFTSTMYGIPMGCENNGERISWQDAIEHTRYTLSNLSAQNGGKPVYIEQFLYYDNTPQFSYNTQIKDDEIGKYIEEISGVLLEYSKGYGVWTYRDYRNDMLYNSQFALGDKGWIVDGTPIFDLKEKSMVCCMSTGDVISQKVPEIRDHFPNEKYELSICVEDYNKSGSVMVISMGNDIEEVRVNGLGTLRLIFDKNESFDLRIYVKEGNVVIDDLCLFSHVQKCLLYDEMNEEQRCIQNIRVLNNKLDMAY